MKLNFSFRLIIMSAVILFIKCQDKLRNIDYLSFGYDIYKGNPLSTIGGVDPGFVIFHVFAFSYSQGQQSDDGRYLIPDNTIVAKEEACLLSFSSSTVTGGSTYKSDLQQHVGGSIEAFGAKFEANLDYTEVHDYTANSKNVYTVSKGECKLYTCKLDPVTYPTLSSDFKTLVSQLPETYDEDAYMNFISTVGTHYVFQAHMGARFSTITRLTQEGWTSLLKKEIKVDVAASYNAIEESGSLDTRSDEQKEETKQFDKAKEETLMSTIGSRPPSGGTSTDWATQTFEDPTPIYYTVKNISDLFDEKYFQNDTPAVSLEKLKANMNTALLNYCQYLIKTGDIKDCNPPPPDPQPPQLYNACILCADNCGGNFPVDNGVYPSVNAILYTGFSGGCNTPYGQISQNHELHLCCQQENDFWHGSCRICVNCGGDYTNYGGYSDYIDQRSSILAYDSRCSGQMTARPENVRKLCCNDPQICIWCTSCGGDFPEETGSFSPSDAVDPVVSWYLELHSKHDDCQGNFDTFQLTSAKLCCRTQGNT